MHIYIYLYMYIHVFFGGAGGWRVKGFVFLQFGLGSTTQTTGGLLAVAQTLRHGPLSDYLEGVSGDVPP